MAKEIPLTKGKVAIVDDDMFDELSKYKWHYSSKYARRTIAGTPDGMDTDHINGNKLDNRRCNLRPATRSQNMHNLGKVKSGSSKYKGVNLIDGKWAATIGINYRRVRIGLYQTEREAAIAYNNEAIRLIGDFATLNMID